MFTDLPAPQSSARHIVAVLGGRWRGRYGMVRCPAHNDRTPSLRICDSADGVRVHCFAGCDWRTVKQTLRTQNILENRWSQPAAAPHDSQVEHNARMAARLWKASGPMSGTAGADYLRTRGIPADDIPATLRFHPALAHPFSRQKHPAIVAAVTLWPHHEVRAVHRTYLAPTPSPHIVHKLEGGAAKCMLGPCRRGAVRLAPLQANVPLVIAEGLETALSVFVATGYPTWAALSANAIPHLILPPPALAPDIIIAADADSPGLKAARAAAAAWTSPDLGGRRVRIAVPPRNLNDFNDLTTGEPKA